LEDDIQDRSEDGVEVSGGGQGQGGWNVDLELLDEDADVHRFPKKLVKFLQKWGVPRDTYSEGVHERLEGRPRGPSNRRLRRSGGAITTHWNGPAWRNRPRESTAVERAVQC
jgi:hypothetical protein